MVDYSRRFNRVVIINLIVSLLLANGAYRYVILKREIESSQILKCNGRKIPWDTWESIIKQLENANIILDRPPKTQTKCTKRTEPYLLALREEIEEEIRRKLTLGLPIIGKNERLEKLYQLILYYDTQHPISFIIPEYENQELQEQLSLLGLKSVDELSESGRDNNRVVTTYYRPVSPSLDIRRTAIRLSQPWSSSIADSLSTVKAVHYSFILLGVSKKDILSSNINHRYLFDDIIFSTEEVDKAFNALLEIKIIKPLDTLGGIIRYSVIDEQLREFVCECFNIRGLLVETIERKFLSDKQHSTGRILMQSIRGWLELLRDGKYVDNMFDYLIISGKNKYGDELFVELETVKYLYSLVDKQINRMRIEYNEIVSKYGYLAESFIEIARSESLRNAIDRFDMGSNNLCSPSVSHNNKIKSLLSNNMNLENAYDILKDNGFPQYCYNTIIRNAGFIVEYKWENSKSIYFIRKSIDRSDYNKTPAA